MSAQATLWDPIPMHAPHNDTSQAAALSMVAAAKVLRVAVLDVLRRHPGGLTADQVAAQLRESVLSIRPRFTELKQGGLIVDTGERRANASGRKAAVWRTQYTPTTEG